MLNIFLYVELQQIAALNGINLNIGLCELSENLL